MTATRKDVAELAGVSSATVSNVINNKDIVSDKLKLKVLKAIDELDYRPNMVARSLKTNKTRQIALVSNDISNPYYAEILLGMEEEARNSGYTVSMINASNNNENHVEKILQRQYDGIIWAADKSPVDTLNFLSKKKPLIFIANEGYKGLSSNIIQIELDIYAGAYRLFKYLIKSGHKRIAYISSRVLDSINEPDYRLRAYLDILDEFNIEFDPSLIYFKSNTYEYVYNSTLDIIKKENPPQAIFTGNDNFALPVISAVNSLGLNIPEDISIAGFDNISASKYYNPTLTTVDMPKYNLGKLSMKTAINNINGQEIDDVLLSTDLIVRDSTENK